MAKQMNYALALYADGVLTIELEPPIAIGGWSIQYFETHRPGNLSGQVIKSMTSGFYAVSGMNIVNSGQGIFSMNVYATDTSGRCPGNYAFQFRRTDSGLHKVLVEGYRIANY